MSLQKETLMLQEIEWVELPSSIGLQIESMHAMNKTLFTITSEAKQLTHKFYNICLTLLLFYPSLYEIWEVNQRAN